MSSVRMVSDDPLVRRVVCGYFAAVTAAIAIGLLGLYGGLW